MVLDCVWHVLMENIVQNCSHIKKNWISNMTIKCLAFDLDGTLLLDDSKRMDPRTVDSIQRAMAQGMHIVIASGRDKTIGIRRWKSFFGISEWTSRI